MLQPTRRMNKKFGCQQQGKPKILITSFLLKIITSFQSRNVATKRVAYTRRRVSVCDIRLRNDLYCVERGVKLYSLTQCATSSHAECPRCEQYPKK